MVGTGNWGSKVIKAIRALGYDVRVCNRSGEYEGQSVCRDYKELIPQVDIVWVATHPRTNRLIAAYALEHNKPTVVEKPVAFTSQEVAGLVRASKAKQVPLIVDYIHMFNPGVLALPLSGEAPLGLDAKIGNNGPVRDYSPLWDYGSHAVAFAMSWQSCPGITGLEVVSVRGRRFYGVINFGHYAFRFDVDNERADRCVEFGMQYTGLKPGGGWRRYRDDGTYKPLQAMISHIASLHLRNEYWTNGDLAVEVTDVLERLHKLLPQ